MLPWTRRMMPIRCALKVQAAIILFLGASLMAPGAATTPLANPTPSVTAAKAILTPSPTPPSVFVNDLKQGRDPFFPNSSRRAQPLAAKTPSPADTRQLGVLDGLTLKAITGTKNRRFAIINTEVYGVGEDHEINVAGQRIAVRCEEISDDSVVVSIAGQAAKKELKLKQF
jgi:hypothetical protein